AQLLQAGLRIHGGAETGRVFEQRPDEPQDERRRDLGSAGEIDRSDDRLDGVGQDGGLVVAAGQFLAATETDELAEAYRARDLRERNARHQARAPFGELAL